MGYSNDNGNNLLNDFIYLTNATISASLSQTEMLFSSDSAREYHWYMLRAELNDAIHWLWPDA